MSFTGPTWMLVLYLLHVHGATGNLIDTLAAAGIKMLSPHRRTAPLEYATRKACRSEFVLGARSGEIASPGYVRGANYTSNMNCVWIIRAPPNKIVRMVVRSYDILCPDSLEMFNYETGLTGYNLATVCRKTRTTGVTNDDTEVYTDSDGAYVTFHTFPGETTGRGFLLHYTVVDQQERPCGIPRIEPFVPGLSGWDDDGSNFPLPPGSLPPLHPGFDPRIIGGADVVPFSWPWHVSISIKDFDVSWCGGVIIGRRWVLTAAHCIGQPFDVDWLVVVTGMYNKTDEGEPSRQTIDILKNFTHSEYNKTIKENNDIVLLYLAEDIRYTPQVSPVCLPSEDVPVNTMCVTTGWGAGHGEKEEILYQVKVPIIDRNVCTQSDWLGDKITESMLCAGYPEGGKDTCQGDSGGPLVSKDGRKWVLHGLTSWGLGDGCGHPRTPGVYTRVAHFLDWIEEVITSNNN